MPKRGLDKMKTKEKAIKLAKGVLNLFLALVVYYIISIVHDHWCDWRESVGFPCKEFIHPTNPVYPD